MKIKKPTAAPVAAAPAGGDGAIMNDRFKLDMPAPGKPAKGGGAAADSGGVFCKIALAAAVLSLLLLGGMVFFLNSSWSQMQLL